MEHEANGLGWLWLRDLGESSASSLAKPVGGICQVSIGLFRLGKVQRLLANLRSDFHGSAQQRTEVISNRAAIIRLVLDLAVRQSVAR